MDRRPSADLRTTEEKFQSWTTVWEESFVIYNFWKNILDEMVLTKINEYYEFSFLEIGFLKNKSLTEVGFEPTPPKRLEP